MRLQHEKNSKSTDLVKNLEIPVAAELWKRLDDLGNEVCTCVVCSAMLVKSRCDDFGELAVHHPRTVLGKA